MDQVTSLQGWPVCIIVDSSSQPCLSECMQARLLQSRPSLCGPMDCNPPGSSIHGILQARILEWVAMPSSRGSSRARDQTLISYISCIGRRAPYHWRHLGSPGVTEAQRASQRAESPEGECVCQKGCFWQTSWPRLPLASHPGVASGGHCWDCYILRL